MPKALFSIFFIFFSLAMFAKEGSVMIYCKSKGAIIYVDGEKNLTIREDMTTLQLEEGDHVIKVVKPFTPQCEKYEEREVYVAAHGSVKVRFSVSEKQEPTETFKKVREKKDGEKWERFARSDVALVSDNVLGIIWQDNETTDTLRDFKKATAYCASLELVKFNDWRLPTYEELLTIVDYDRYNVALMPSFKNAFASPYWSSTKDASSPEYIWRVDFFHGESKSNRKEKKYHTRCVRGISKDRVSNLIWDDSKASEVIKKDWENAKGYCQKMVLGNKNDWRLPTIKELQSIVSSKEYKPAIKNGFKYVAEDFYWSSTEDISTDGYAWNVAFNYGYTTRTSTLNEYGVRCVRDE